MVRAWLREVCYSCPFSVSPGLGWVLRSVLLTIVLLCEDKLRKNPKCLAGLASFLHLSSRLCVSRNCEGMESRVKKMSDPNEEEDDDPKMGDELELPSLDSLGRPVIGSRSVHGANIGLVQETVNIIVVEVLGLDLLVAFKYPTI